MFITTKIFCLTSSRFFFERDRDDEEVMCASVTTEAGDNAK